MIAHPHDCRGLSCDHPDHWTECGAEMCRGAVEGRPAIIPRGIPSGLCPSCMDVPTCPACGVPVEPGGCDCYGIPTPAPHYPTSADLAAFRRDIRPDVDDTHPDASPAMAAYHGLAGAWSSERREGIGYRFASDPTWNATARREASALRSRAFARVDGALKADAWRREWAGIRETFAPRHRRPRAR